MSNIQFGIASKIGESDGVTEYERAYTSDLFSECLKEWHKKKYTFPECIISVYERDSAGCYMWVAEIDMSDIIAAKKPEYECPYCGEEIKIYVGDKCGSETDGSVSITHCCDYGLSIQYCEMGQDTEEAKKSLILFENRL